MRIFTIGHSNQTLESFLALLHEYDLRVVVDIRSKPFSRYAPQFNRWDFARALREHSIVYVYMGDRLGGKPEDVSLYEDGVVSYDKIRETSFYQDGIADICENLGKLKQMGLMSVLMCSEECPDACHRRLLVGKDLLSLGIEVTHVRGDGVVETEGEVTNRLCNTPILDLFGG